MIVMDAGSSNGIPDRSIYITCVTTDASVYH